MIASWTRYRATRQLRRCDHVGAGVAVTGVPVVQNLGRISIGDGVVLESEPAISHLVTGPHGAVEIGAGSALGQGCAIASHESITIGEHVTIGPYAMVMDTDFHQAGQHDAAGGTGAIHIGDGARLGARVTVLRGSVIGAGAIVDAGSVVKGHVPAHARVAGNPARIVTSGSFVGTARDIDLDAVRDVVAQTFGLAERPPADATRDTITQWDSLGMLNLLLSLEAAFDVNLGSDAMHGVRCVADLVPVLESAASA